MELTKETENLLIMKLLGIESNQSNSEPRTDILAHLIGKKVVIRDDLAGIIVTTLLDIRGSEWVGGESRKVHYWSKAGAVEGIAETGISLDDSRVTVKTGQSNGKTLVQVCICNDDVFDLIMGADVWNPK